MKKLKLIALPLLLFSQSIKAQSTANGSIVIPSLQSVNIDVLDDKPMSFSNIAEFRDGKLVPSYGSLTIKSNVPWILSAKLNPMSFKNGIVPPQLISIKLQGTNQFINLTENYTPILVSSNDLITNQYLIDLKVNPQLNVLQQLLMLDIQFKVSPQ